MHPSQRPPVSSRPLSVTLLALLTAAASSGCVLCVTGSGNVVTEERSIGAYRAVRIDGSIDLQATASSELPSGRLELETDDNLLPLVRTWIDGTTLVIDTEAGVCVDPSGPLLVRASLDGVTSLLIDGSGSVVCTLPFRGEELEVEIDGSGDVRLTDIELEWLETRIDGSGDVHYAGQARYHELEIDGSGGVDAFELATTETRVVVDGSGDASVSARERLDILIDGSGEVTYAGEPQELKTRIDGSGEISSRSTD